MSILNSKNYYWIFNLDCGIISELEVKCEDLEWERDVYLDYLIDSQVNIMKTQLNKNRGI